VGTVKVKKVLVEIELSTALGALTVMMANGTKACDSSIHTAREVDVL
jgi:hypothetical protein